jgi:HlyD family secretion protein
VRTHSGRSPSRLRSTEAGFSIVTLLVILALVGGGAWWFFFRTSSQAPTIAFNSTKLTRGDVVQAITATGELQPVLVVDVSSQISGLLTEVLVDFNDRVSQGDVLARIDPATYESRLASAQADLANAEANHRLATLNNERSHSLFARNLIPLQEVDQSDAQLAQAQAQLLTRTSSVNNAKTDLERCTLYAPIDGFVIDRLAEVGKTVAASLNAPTLFTLVNDLRVMEIKAYVSEADIGSVAQEQNVNFTVDAYPDRTFKGKVTQIRNSPQREQSVIVYSTIVSVNNADLRLKPGMTANVSIVTASRENVVRIANSALRLRVPDGVTIIESEQPNAPASTGNEAAEPADPRAQFRALIIEAGGTGEGRPDPEILAKVRELAQARGIELPQRGGAGGGAGGGGGGGAGAGGGGRGGDSERPQRQTPTDNRPTVRTIYTQVPDAATPTLKSIRVRLGISDGSTTEVLGGVEEGEAIVTGLALTLSKADTTQNPFASSQRRGPGR